MIKFRNTLSIIVISSLILIACSKVPVTGRKQVNLLPESTLRSMSLTQYKTFLSQNKMLATNDTKTSMVQTVGSRIQSAVTTYMKSENQSKRIEGYKWEFNVVDDNVANAWAMPGGKVVVYTGLLPITQDATGLAVVMGHEIAHAIARHGNERMSQQMVAAVGGIGLAVALSDKPRETQNLFLAAYGVGSTLGILKYSRLHESEADKMGLIFMAMAGYNPDKAVDFWQRMKQTGGANVPEFLSTHPSHDTRIKEINNFLPEARQYYAASNKVSG